MSTTPFHDLADEYDALTDKLRAHGDAWGTGQMTVPVVEEPEPPGEPEHPIEPPDKPGQGPKAK